MALKEKEKEKENMALAVLSDVQVDDGSENLNKFLPFMMYGWPINSEISAECHNKFSVGNQPLEAPYTVVRLKSFGAMRKNSEDGTEYINQVSDPDKYKEWQEKFDPKNYVPNAHGGQSLEYEKGVKYILAIIKDDQVALCVYGGFKLEGAYMANALMASSMADGTGTEMLITKHDKNFTKYNKGSSFDPNKLLYNEHYKVVDLTKEQVAQIVAAAEKNESKLKAALAR